MFRVTASLRIIRNVLSTASTTKAVDAAPAMPGRGVSGLHADLNQHQRELADLREVDAGAGLARRPCRMA
jgi:hypothetical protein